MTEKIVIRRDEQEGRILFGKRCQRFQRVSRKSIFWDILDINNTTPLDSDGTPLHCFICEYRCLSNTHEKCCVLQPDITLPVKTRKKTPLP